MAKTSSTRRRSRWRWLERLLNAIGLICLGTALATVAEGRIYQLLGRWQLDAIDPADAAAAHVHTAGVWLGHEVADRWDSPIVWATDRVADATGDLPWSAWVGWARDRLQALRPHHMRPQHAASRDSTAAPAPAPGAPVGTIMIPEIGLDAVILEGVRTDVLRRGVGHFPQTPMPGAGGNSALAGHRDTFFRSLRHVRAGQRVVVTTADRRELVYRVESTEVIEPTGVEVLDDSSRETLTLITCYPFHYVGPAPQRFVVRCRADASSADRSTVK